LSKEYVEPAFPYIHLLSFSIPILQGTSRASEKTAAQKVRAPFAIEQQLRASSEEFPMNTCISPMAHSLHEGVTLISRPRRRCSLADQKPK
jgi:hypothetical protein